MLAHEKAARSRLRTGPGADPAGPTVTFYDPFSGPMRRLTGGDKHRRRYVTAREEANR